MLPLNNQRHNHANPPRNPPNLQLQLQQLLDEIGARLHPHRNPDAQVNFQRPGAVHLLHSPAVESV
jgi:hypothetical protein